MGIRDLHFIPDQKDIMAKAFRELIGVGPSTASTKDSVLVIIDAQNEYANGQLKTENVASTRKAISSLLEKYRATNAPLVHIVHQTPSGAPVFTADTRAQQRTTRASATPFPLEFKIWTAVIIFLT